jgi:hypothetical protein
VYGRKEYLMTTVTDSVRRQTRQPSLFYLAMAGVFALVAFAGFTRTYLLPVVMNRFDGPAFLHIHGALFLGWTVLLAWQSGLVRWRRVEAHRAWGMAGIALATAMVFTAIVLVIRGLESSVAAGTLDRVRLLAIAPLSQIALFGAFVAAAVASVRRPETHGRLMLVATTNLLPAAVARLFGLVLAPLRRNAPGPNAALVANVNLGFNITLAAALVVDLFIVAAIVRDWRTRGRPHSAYVIGGTCMLLVQLLRRPFAYTDFWHWITDGLLALAR